MEKHYTETKLTKWFHEQVNIWNNIPTWFKILVKIGWAYLILYFTYHVKIIIL
jgi:hypothetical protein